MLCWGNTRHGQLGLGGIDDEIVSEPRANKNFPGEMRRQRVVEIACGYNHTLFLLDDGTVYSCGNNDYEQLGHDGSRTRPELVASLETQFITHIAAGHSFSLALSKTGNLYCWGAITGDTESKFFHSKPFVIKVDSPVIQMQAGYYHIVMLTEDGKVYVMGANDYGQLGIGTVGTASPEPVYLQSIQGIPVLQIACGAFHSLVLTVSGNIFSFGRNDFGQLGVGDENNRSYPVNLKNFHQLRACYITCGENFTSVLTLEGGVFTFGAGMYGQLGHNSSSNENLPRKVQDLMGSEITQIACGRCHMLAYSASGGRLYTFGLAGNGQLGLGQLVNKTSPSPVKINLVNPKNPGQNIDSASYLYSVSAGGDQSFVLCNPAKSGVKPLDYRTIYAKSNHILTVNILEELSGNKPLAKTISSQTSSAINQIAILNPNQLKTVQTVFNSASCLNASFLDKEQHYMTSNKYPGVDIAMAKNVYSFISSLNDDYLKDIIVERLHDLFKNLPESPPSIEALRLYVTTPFIAEFDKLSLNEHSVHSLLYEYAKSINKLKKEAAGRVLDYWFAWTGVEFFSKLIKTYKNIVTHIINLKETHLEEEQRRRHNTLYSSMMFLQKLHKINLEYREIVPYDHFYIPELIDKIDVKKDYVEWIRRKSLRLSEQHSYQVFNLIELPEGESVLFCDFPFVFDGRAKTLLLQTDAEIQMQIALREAYTQNLTSIFLPTIDPVNPFLCLFVRRDHIVQDTLNQLSKQKRDDLKKPLKVMFIGEDGYDAGGVKKEFFMLLIREILDLKYGMFVDYQETHSIWFNDQTLEGSEMYHLIGVLCGLAIYNSIIIDLPFPLALYKKLLKEPVTLKDMYGLSPSVAQSLDMMLKYEGDDFQTTFELTFEITRQRFDQTITVELVPNGANIPVTKDNCKQYVNAYIDYIFNKSVDEPFAAFSAGFHHVCGSKVLELFHSSELMSLVIGNLNYDFEEFEKNAEYKGDYNPEHPVIKNFWKVFHSLSIEQKKKFLLFLTGTDRIPILGMKRVKIFIQSTNGGDSFFPVAHTCFNLLDLPQYSSEQILRERLLVAIEHTQGFTIV